MIKRELLKDPNLKNENWSRFLPNYKSKKVTKKPKKREAKRKKEYTPFPPPPTESKVDKLLASGEYFMKEDQKRRRKRDEKLAKQQEKEKERLQKRALPFVPPNEEDKPTASCNESSVDLEALKAKVKKIKTK